jgi:hypothetical protein
MYIHEMREAISKARRTLDSADAVAASIGYILENRLRQLSHSTLAKIKKELKNYNSHTGEWK